MHSRAKQVSALFLPALLSGMLLLGACENDLKQIKQISAKLVSQPIDTTRGVEVIYSDSAIVKGKMITPLLIHYDVSKSVAKPYYSMPKGVKVIIYDKDAKEIGNIVSDSAAQHEKEHITEFFRNVVATNIKGETYKSDELIWDQDKKIFYSNKPVQITMAGGDIMNGTSFKSDDKFNNPHLTQSTGLFNVSDLPAN
ncbi:MAG TPA: LPS export ABC transporter periplasmic protein LptC [Mucilaginibacter sp.]|jgi:LPS export ABC transporter protein LptC|nr:LPS export ABC transporter periplasmic protein LptC [Mucilaginibacter sp.]